MPEGTFSLIGRSPGEASGQQLPWTQFYTGHNDANLNRILAGMAEERAGNRAARLEDEQGRQFDIQATLAALQRAESRRQWAESQTENQRRYGLERGDVARAEARTERDAPLQRALIQSQTWRNLNYEQPGQRADTRFGTQTVEEMADRGEINDTEHALRLLGAAGSRDTAEVLAARSAHARADINMEYDQLENSARAATDYQAAKAELTAASNAPVSPQQAAQVAAAQAKVNQLKPAFDEIVAAQRAGRSRLTFDRGTWRAPARPTFLQPSAGAASPATTTGTMGITPRPPRVPLTAEQRGSMATRNDLQRNYALGRITREQLIQLLMEGDY